MNCTSCNDKICRKEQSSCSQVSFEKEDMIQEYLQPENSQIVQTAAHLVDHDRAGSLSRVEEIIEFILTMKYKKVGIAYCYGMENYIKMLEARFKEKGIESCAVSCTVGGLKQSEVNSTSCIHKVSCNPIGQAQHLNNENVDLTLIVGICVGHDILLNRNLKMDFTTLVVKDRKFNHSPLKGFNKPD